MGVEETDLDYPDWIRKRALGKTKLKPCPCCGNAKVELGRDGMDGWMVRCFYWKRDGESFGGCGLRMRRTWEDGGKKRDSMVNFDTGAARAAIRAWNRRKPA